jgi:hypothetical protein
MWTYVLTDLDGVEIGEIKNATSRTLSLALNRAATSSFTVRLDNPAVSALFAGDTMLKVYEGSTLRFRGNVVSTELATSGDEPPSVRVNAANPAWKLARRLLGLSKGGTKYEGDRAKIARKMINTLNTDTVTYATNPETGILLLEESKYEGGKGIYIAGPYRPALTCINDLAHTLDGFDWFISPLDNPSFPDKIGTFEATNKFGNSLTTVFEYGFGQKNVRAMNYIRDLNDLTNKVYHLPNDLETESVLARPETVFEDVTSMEYRGRYEGVADAFGITDKALREAWLEEVFRVRKNPRYVLSMTLDIDDGTGRVPQLGTDYWLGDTAKARAMLQGNLLFDGEVRIYGVDIEIAESGTSRVTPILLDEEGESL